MPVSTLFKLCLAVVPAIAGTPAPAEVVIDPAILEAVASGPVRVIVELRLDNGFTPEGELGEQGVEAQRAAIAASQDSVLAALAGDDARLLRRYDTVPFLTLDIEAASLARLRAMPDRVVRILDDGTAATQRPR